MMARSNPHSSMPSPARSPIGKDQNDVDDYEDNGVDDRQYIFWRIKVKLTNSGESRERIRLPVTPSGLGGRPLMRPKRQVT